jgi:WD40 repeat protein
VKLRILTIFLLFLLTGCSLSYLSKSQPSTSTQLPIVQTQTSTLPLSTNTPLPAISESLTAEPPLTITRENANYLVEISSIPLENISRLYWLPGNNSLAVINMKGIKLLDGSNLSAQKEFKFAENTSLLDFNPASQRMALTSDRLKITILDLQGNTIQTISPAGGFGSAGFSPNGDNIWLTSMEEFKAISYDINTGKEADSCGGFETAAPVYSAFPSPRGNWLVWIARAIIQLNRLSDCQVKAHIGHEDFIISHSFSHDESILVTSTGGTINGEMQPLIYFWDTKTGNQKAVIVLQESPATDLAFSSDDTLLASAGSGLIIWDAQSGKELKKLSPIDRRFTAVAFSPDGKYLAASTETNLYLFSIRP